MKKNFFLLVLFLGIIVSAQNSNVDSTNLSPVIETSQIPDYETIKTKIDLKDVVTKADQLPEFPGGMKKFKKRFFESLKMADSKMKIENLKEKIFQNLKFSDSGKNKENDTHLYFIIEKNGYVKNFTAVGSSKKNIKAAEIAIKGVFERWKPASVKGENVRYLVYFPLEESSLDTNDDDNLGQILSVAEFPDLEYVKSKIDLKGVVSKADEKPEFPGGIEVFKGKYFETIETLDIKVNEKIDTRLYFIVEKNGYVRNVVATGSNKKHAEEAELGMIRMNTRWKPAKLNGEAVRYIFYFPLKNKKFDY